MIVFFDYALQITVPLVFCTYSTQQTIWNVHDSSIKIKQTNQTWIVGWILVGWLVANFLNQHNIKRAQTVICLVHLGSSMTTNYRWSFIKMLCYVFMHLNFSQSRRAQHSIISKSFESTASTEMHKGNQFKLDIPANFKNSYLKVLKSPIISLSDYFQWINHDKNTLAKCACMNV